MLDQLTGGVEQSLRCGDCGACFGGFDLLARECRIFELVAPSAQGAELCERATELVADRLADDEVPSCLCWTKALVRQQCGADERAASYASTNADSGSSSTICFAVVSRRSAWRNHGSLTAAAPLTRSRCRFASRSSMVSLPRDQRVMSLVFGARQPNLDYLTG